MMTTNEVYFIPEGVSQYSVRCHEMMTNNEACFIPEWDIIML